MQAQWRYYAYLLPLLLLCQNSWGQNKDSLSLKRNFHTKTIRVADSVKIDSLSVEAKSFSIKNIPDSDYLLRPEQSLLIWKHKPIKDSVTIQYRTLPFSFVHRHQHKSRQAVDSNIAFPFYSYSEKAENTDNHFVNFKSIEYNGTYGRSLTIGNQQDVTLNSNFNLQLNGYILDSVHILASLSDNNIPFQPDGNTQQIQEFDKIFITFEKGGHKLTAGDYEITQPQSYFLNFDKRVQGLYYQGTFPKSKKVENKIGISGSIAKGEYARNIFEGQEGNQGPYKLTGNNGEQFFIVLAGTEKVYIDGILMQRGEDKDYTIDYNTAEITFMPSRMITKDSRIQVEFEYQSQNYLNTLFYAYDELSINKKWQIKFHAYSNQDSKNQSYLQNLTDTQKQFLRGIGDRINEAFYPNIRQDTFASNKILYRIKDTLINGHLYDSVFVYSTNKDSTLYSLGFSFAGNNKGNYNLSTTNANGRAYQWVAPQNGIPQGSYVPYVLLVTPKKQQVFTLGSSYQIDSTKQVGIELASSNYNPNLFADSHQADHWGFAGKGFYNGKTYLGQKDSTGKYNLAWINSFDYEWTQSRFQPIAPFRNVEFNRDWNLNDTSVLNKAPSDQLLTFQTQLNKLNWGNISYQFSRYTKGSEFNANRNVVNFNLLHNNYKAGAVFNLMQSKDNLQTSEYLRPSAFVERTFRGLDNLTIGAKWEEEHNEIRLLQNDTLSSASFAYHTLGVYLKNEESKKLNFSLGYNYREDLKPAQEDFTTLSKSNTLTANLNLNQWKGQQISLTGSYRLLSTKDSSLIHSENGGQNIVARLQYNGTILKGFIVPSVLYEIGSGQQQKQEYIYVKVPTGQGVYMWVDYNKDGVQQDNEFEIALYPDQKQYIRILSPTNDYIAVNYVTLTQSLLINPENLWRNKKKTQWEQFFSRFSNQLSLQVNNKSLTDAGLSGFNPFTQSIADENIITNSTSFNNTFYFNQLSSVWGISYNYLSRSGKSLLTYGIDGTNQKSNLLNARLVFLKKFTATLNLQQGIKSHLSALPDDSSSYFIKQASFQPGITWLKPSLMRISGSYKFDQRQNRFDFGGQKATIQSFDVNVKFSFLNTGNINLSATYADINYDGQDNTALSFAMLDALKKGNNWLWHIGWDRNIGKGIQISLEYDGRKPAGSAIIHTGTMSIRALL